ncbi:MAG: LysR substrate-binding domain-containing protein [Actinomycetota bacterium]|nr:LysR substrate-binding domain-containing protein [Actinomycetota bacterium]
MIRPTIRQLEYLVAVAEEGHVGRAARRSHVAQPSLSAQLKELERQLGAPVTERIGRGVQLTPIGRELADRARLVLRVVDDLIVAARRSSEQLGGWLRVAAIPTVAPYLLPAFVPLSGERHPAVQLHLSEMRTPDLVLALAGGQVDLGLLALPIVDDSIDHVVIRDDPFLVAVSTGHEFVADEDVDIAQLADQPMLLLEDGHCLRDQALEICGGVGATESPSIQATSLPTLCQMVAAGLGVTLLPQSARSVEARQGAGIVVRPFSDARPSRQIVLAWRASSPAASLYRELGELTATALAAGGRS